MKSPGLIRTQYGADDYGAWVTGIFAIGMPYKNQSYEVNGKTVPGTTMHLHYKQWSSLADKSVAGFQTFKLLNPDERMFTLFLQEFAGGAE